MGPMGEGPRDAERGARAGRQPRPTQPKAPAPAQAAQEHDAGLRAAGSPDAAGGWGADAGGGADRRAVGSMGWHPAPVDGTPPRPSATPCTLPDPSTPLDDVTSLSGSGVESMLQAVEAAALDVGSAATPGVGMSLGRTLEGWMAAAGLEGALATPARQDLSRLWGAAAETRQLRRQMDALREAELDMATREAEEAARSLGLLEDENRALAAANQELQHQVVELAEAPPAQLGGDDCAGMGEAHLAAVAEHTMQQAHNARRLSDMYQAEQLESFRALDAAEQHLASAEQERQDARQLQAAQAAVHAATDAAEAAAAKLAMALSDKAGLEVRLAALAAQLEAALGGAANAAGLALAERLKDMHVLLREEKAQRAAVTEALMEHAARLGSRYKYLYGRYGRLRRKYDRLCRDNDDMGGALQAAHEAIYEMQATAEHAPPAGRPYMHALEAELAQQRQTILALQAAKAELGGRLQVAGALAAAGLKTPGSSLAGSSHVGVQRGAPAAASEAACSTPVRSRPVQAGDVSPWAGSNAGAGLTAPLSPAMAAVLASPGQVTPQQRMAAAHDELQALQDTQDALQDRMEDAATALSVLAQRMAEPLMYGGGSGARGLAAAASPEVSLAAGVAAPGASSPSMSASASCSVPAGTPASGVSELVPASGGPAGHACSEGLPSAAASPLLPSSTVDWAGVIDLLGAAGTPQAADAQSAPQPATADWAGVLGVLCGDEPQLGLAVARITQQLPSPRDSRCHGGASPERSLSPWEQGSSVHVHQAAAPLADSTLPEWGLPVTLASVPGPGSPVDECDRGQPLSSSPGASSGASPAGSSSVGGDADAVARGQGVATLQALLLGTPGPATPGPSPQAGSQGGAELLGADTPGEAAADARLACEPWAAAASASLRHMGGSDAMLAGAAASPPALGVSPYREFATLRARAAANAAAATMGGQGLVPLPGSSPTLGDSGSQHGSGSLDGWGSGEGGLLPSGSLADLRSLPRPGCPTPGSDCSFDLAVGGAPGAAAMACQPRPGASLLRSASEAVQLSSSVDGGSEGGRSWLSPLAAQGGLALRSNSDSAPHAAGALLGGHASHASHASRFAAAAAAASPQPAPCYASDAADGAGQGQAGEAELPAEAGMAATPGAALDRAARSTLLLPSQQLTGGGIELFGGSQPPLEGEDGGADWQLADAAAAAEPALQQPSAGSAWGLQLGSSPALAQRPLDAAARGSLAAGASRQAPGSPRAPGEPLLLAGGGGTPAPPARSHRPSVAASPDCISLGASPGPAGAGSRAAPDQATPGPAEEAGAEQAGQPPAAFLLPQVACTPAAPRPAASGALGSAPPPSTGPGVSTMLRRAAQVSADVEAALAAARATTAAAAAAAAPGGVADAPQPEADDAAGDASLGQWQTPGLQGTVYHSTRRSASGASGSGWRHGGDAEAAVARRLSMAAAATSAGSASACASSAADGSEVSFAAAAAGPVQAGAHAAVLATELSDDGISMEVAGGFGRITTTATASAAQVRARAADAGDVAGERDAAPPISADPLAAAMLLGMVAEGQDASQLVAGAAGSATKSQAGRPAFTTHGAQRCVGGDQGQQTPDWSLHGGAAGAAGGGVTHATQTTPLTALRDSPSRRPSKVAQHSTAAQVTPSLAAFGGPGDEDQQGGRAGEPVAGGARGAARHKREQQAVALEKTASNMMQNELRRRAEALGVRLSPFLRRRESSGG